MLNWVLHHAWKLGMNDIICNSMTLQLDQQIYLNFIWPIYAHKQVNEKVYYKSIIRRCMCVPEIHFQHSTGNSAISSNKITTRHKEQGSYFLCCLIYFVTQKLPCSLLGHLVLQHTDCIRGHLNFNFVMLENPRKKGLTA